MSSIQHQIAAFISGSSSEYSFPVELSIEERKLVKITAEKFGLSSRSFGMGSERRIHIFKPASSVTAALEPVEYSVKNTFIDGPVVDQASVGPAHQSMPAGAFEGHLAAEQESLPAIVLAKACDSPRNSEVDTSSTKDSDSEIQDAPISIKNTFVHFETDCKEHLDPRIIQSMPAGTFADNIQAEREAAHNAGSSKRRPLPLSENSETETEGSSTMLFPSTPNGENQISFGTGHAETIPAVQWIPPTSVAAESCATIMPPALWAPSSHAQVVLENDGSSAAAPPQGPGPLQGPPQYLPSPAAPASSVTVLPSAVWSPTPPVLERESSATIPAGQGPPQQGPAPPMPPQAPQEPAPTMPVHDLMQRPAQGPTMLMPPQEQGYFAPGTSVVLQGLASQPDFNGLHGIVSAFDADCGRYNIMIEIGPNALKRLVKVKFQNLVPTQPMLMAQPPCYPPAQQPVAMNRPAKASLLLDQMV
eukprot:gnl/MRDRNA2_/MRDRNA2_90637_c0_seq1.p1 gnl/MRDRNA2_/MRDRNA2_90637_c0~~gnl/MRDRNA2_/MRDRNA2_90637_c0_seq1.p1  ORF type:complete len:503 (+),score=121.42 gnl/MRDRNA2_/MRDRNA2_90637_c0_seq1:86-1510(+)